MDPKHTIQQLGLIKNRGARLGSRLAYAEVTATDQIPQADVMFITDPERMMAAWENTHEVLIVQGSDSLPKPSYQIGPNLFAIPRDRDDFIQHLIREAAQWYKT